MSKTPTELMPRDANYDLTHQPRGWALDPNTIDSKWIELMAKRLFVEIDRQLAQLENSGATNNPQERATNARAIASLERAYGRLARSEHDRDTRREKKDWHPDGSTRKILEGKFRLVHGRQNAGKIPGEADGG
jgi:hypothetical protein